MKHNQELIKSQINDPKLQSRLQHVFNATRYLAAFNQVLGKFSRYKNFGYFEKENSENRKSLCNYTPGRGKSKASGMEAESSSACE